MTLNIDQLEGMCEFLYNTHPQLRISQLRFLAHVHNHPNRSLSEIAVALGQTLPAISRAIDVFGEPKKAVQGIYPWALCLLYGIPWMTV